ncbi:unnamed protein product [Coregonus sp. 'balchen']|nr:unnamed protein product [Coregonus sp. 'balchen']
MKSNQNGIQIGFDPNEKPGHRVIAKTVKVQGKSLDRDRKYAGKDGYTMFSSCPHRNDIENAQILSTILINHFESGHEEVHVWPQDGPHQGVQQPLCVW